MTISRSFKETWDDSMDEKIHRPSTHGLTKWYYHIWGFFHRNAFYLLPILLGIFGGIFVDKTKAENLGYVGYFLTIFYFSVFIYFFPLHA
jgi:hypothetical protein